MLEDTTGAAAAAAASAAASAASTGNKLRPKSPYHLASYNQRLQNPPKLRHVCKRKWEAVMSVLESGLGLCMLCCVSDTSSRTLWS